MPYDEEMDRRGFLKFAGVSAAAATTSLAGCTGGEDDELFYVLSGRVTFEIGDERISVTPGSTVYAPHGIPHSYVTEEETRSLIQVFKPGFEQFFAGVGRPAESWTIPTEGPTEEEMAKVSEVAGQYSFEIIGPPLNAEH